MKPNSETAAEGVNKLTSAFTTLVTKGSAAADLLARAEANFDPSKSRFVPSRSVPTDPSKTLKAMPVVDQTAYQKGLQLAIDNANQTVKFINQAIAKVASINMPTPNESKYQQGLQLAINNAAQTVKLITTKLMQISGIKVPPPNESKYQKGLQLAIDNAAQTKKFIEKELNKIGGIKVPAPKFNNFNSALDQAVSDAKRAVREINNALTKVKKPSSGGGNGSGPGATTGPFNTASKSDSGGGDTIVYVNVMDETIMRRITARSGRNRFTLGV